MVPADLIDYGPQLAELMGARYQMFKQGASRRSLDDIDKSIDAVLYASAAQQKQFQLSRPHIGLDHDQDRGR